ncbi:MAG: phosphoribosylformylglycinamidine synthase subunit PurQ, partial [Planctomycetota bacterium]
GKILANQIVHHLLEPIQSFIDQGKLVLGICNGFQVLVKAGILPGRSSDERQEEVTITYNDSAKFEDRWVYLAPQTDRCVFIEPGRQIYLPIAHGEGKVVVKDEATLEQFKSEGHVAFKYVDANGREGDYPVNPNGSVDSIAGLTDATGRVLGLMPHPERFVRPTQHPRWSRSETIDSDGMTIFSNAVRYVQENSANRHFSVSSRELSRNPIWGPKRGNFEYFFARSAIMLSHLRFFLLPFWFHTPNLRIVYQIERASCSCQA